MTFLATFHTHFDANVFLKKIKSLGSARMKPVPRSLSSSCGTCVEFLPDNKDFSIDTLLSWEYEDIYIITEEGFKLLHHKE